MRVIYADAGLTGEVGHHANSCRFITGALRARGHDVTIAAYQGIQPELAAELGAIGHFRVNTYQSLDQDPICGWLASFFGCANVLAEDLARLGPFRSRDLLYLNSVMPGQLMGLRSFLLGLADHERPHVITEIGTGPGLDYVQTAEGPRFVARDTRVDSRATLYRFAGMQVRASSLSKLRVCTFDRTSSEVYSLLLGFPVTTLPLPHIAAADPRRRGATRPLTIGILGHQRGEKGYHLVPAISTILLQRRSDIRLLVHNAAPDFMAEVQAAMRVLAAANDRITLDERPAGPALWQELLDRSDLILCPYVPDQFRAGYSAVASEAIANAIPLVVPAETTLARIMAEFGDAGTCFPGHTPEAVAEATHRALDDFESIASRAMSGALRWRALMGAEAMVDAMLAVTAEADMMTRQTRGGPPRAAHLSTPAQKVA